MPITKEREYDDREIILRDHEVCKLSDLTKEERDIFWAGYDDGHDYAKSEAKDEAAFMFIAYMVVMAIIVVAFSTSH